MSDKFYSSRLLNYIERVDVGGYPKTAFYTEINTNFKAGDKIFILNGNYDSDEYIDQDRYAKYVDGYRVLSVDRCRIVLDIDFTGYKPYETDNIDNFIKVWNVRSLREILYTDTLVIDSYDDRRVSKFEHQLSNNIIFSENIYNVTRPDLSTYSIGSTSSFWAKQSNGNYINISSDFDSNTFTQSYFGASYSLTNNGRLLIYNEDFTYDDKLFKQRNVYKFENDEWIIDIKYKQPIISKLNFRDGRFEGTHWDGTFGTYQKSLEWIGTYSNWQSGVLVNSNWVNGNLNSKSTVGSQSYYAFLDDNSLPVQTSDFSNNRGQGYNYILDSNVSTGIISDGNFINCNIGNTLSSTFSAVDDYYNPSYSYQLEALGGYYNFCDVFNSKISDGVIFDSRVHNSTLNLTRMLNSQFSDSVADGEFNSDNGVKVLSADIYSYIPNLPIGSTTAYPELIRGVLKLYISDKDLLRIDNFDRFYINKINKGYIINSLNSDQRIILPFETKYILDRFWNSDFSDQEFTGSIKVPGDNTYKPFVGASNSLYFNAYQASGITYSSIDLDLGSILAHYYQGGAVGTIITSVPTYSTTSGRIIDDKNVRSLFTGTFLSNSDFTTGILTDTDWVSGDMINRQSNIISKYGDGSPIITSNVNYLDVEVSGVDSFADDLLEIGRDVWLDSIYDSSGTSISGRYKIVNIQNVGSNKNISLESQDGISVPSLTGGYTVDPSNHPYFLSIHTNIITDSNIKSGLFKRSLISNSIFKNDLFDNLDRTLNPDNIDKLRIIKTTFKNNLNTINNGLFYKSHILGATWSGGISYQSIWKNTEFNSGLFKSGFWKNGIFNDGYFIESAGLTTSDLDFSYPPEYNNWNDGEFKGGQFESSVWLSGTFSNGKLYQSDWYGGNWVNGILGDSNLPSIQTTMGYYQNIGTGSTFTYWQDGVVSNAQIGGSGSVYWYGGKFNNGVFTSFGVTSSQSIWYDGEFNGGSFEKLAKWKDGNFNGGFFNSYYGWTMSSSTSSLDYGWESGEFNGGQFGNGSYVTNSNWFDGNFNDGIFKGRVWNNGIFNKGNFIGGSTWSSIQNEDQFVNSFTSSYYGLWRNGVVIDSKLNIPSDQKYFTKIKRVKEIFKTNVDVNIKNILWLGGTFSSNSAIMENSIWLKGSFQRGKFTDGSFNPYVDRSNFYDGITSTQSFVLDDSCIWNGGTFDRGNFYVSQWEDGVWVNGTMSGGIWRNGTWNYGNANNIYWESGTWRNGNWDGSPFLPTTYQSDAITSTHSIPGAGQFLFVADTEFPVGLKLSITQGVMVTVGTVSTSSYSDPNWSTTIGVNSGTPNLSAITKIEVVDGINNYQRNLLTRVSQYSATSSVHIINAFTGPTAGSELLNVSIVNESSDVGTQSTVKLSQWDGVTFSKYSEGDGTSLHPHNYIFKTLSVRLATTTSNIILSGTQSIDGVSVVTGDRILVKNQSTSSQNGVYVVNTSGAYTRATDSNTAALLTRSGDDYQTYFVELGNTNVGTYWSQTEILTSLTDPIKFTGGDGRSKWNMSPLDTHGYVYSISSTIYPQSISASQSDPYYYGSTKALTLLGMGVTASIFNEPVGYSGDGGRYDIEVKYDLLNEYTRSGSPVSVTQSCTVTFVTGTLVDGTPDTHTRSHTVPITVGSGDRYTFTYSYYPTTNAWISQTHSTTLYPKQSQIKHGYDTIPAQILQVYGGYSAGQTDIVDINIYSLSVVKVSPNYDPVYNNKLFKVLKSDNPTYSTTAFLPLDTKYIASSDSADTISIKFGNGMFKSGVWENGVWNNGYRNDSTIKRCLFNSKYYNIQEANTAVYVVSNVDYIKLSSTSWLIYLKSLDSISEYGNGDKVSVSNIISIDGNEKRNLIKGYSTVYNIDISNRTMVIKVDVPANTIRIEMDSDKHMIMVTRNVWISGAFLNGVFKNGIWNYGLFQGYPYITLMDSSHWIDGILDGGTFRGGQSVFTMSQSNLSIYSGSYSVPLVQNFDFTDNNISTPFANLDYSGANLDAYYTGATKYLSWMDVNYFTYSKTNIGKETQIYDSTVSESTTEINLSGYPTYDVLSSKSTFRDLTSTTNRSYSLGIKYKVYQYFVPESDVLTQFSRPSSNVTSPTKLFTSLSRNGWTYSRGAFTSSYVGNIEPRISSNLTNLNTGILEISVPDNSFTYLNNTNTISSNNPVSNFQIGIEPNRYSMIEFQLDKFSGNSTYSSNVAAVNGNKVAYPVIYLMNDPRHDSPGSPNHQAINIDIINHATTPDPVKREFFYNRQSLGMNLGGGFTASFSKLAFNEVDMIPFFQYATESHIEKDIKSPFRSVAPIIDYNNTLFNFIGSITLTIDSLGNYSVPVGTFTQDPGMQLFQYFRTS